MKTILGSPPKKPWVNGMNELNDLKENLDEIINPEWFEGEFDKLLEKLSQSGKDTNQILGIKDLLKAFYTKGLIKGIRESNTD